MARNIQIYSTSKTGGQWMSVSDLMAGLMIVFMFISVSFMLKVNSESDDIRNIAEGWAETKQNIYIALLDEFRDDLSKWHAEIKPNSLIVKFKEPNVLFHKGECSLTKRFEDILQDFFPRYLLVLKKFSESIHEIRIEGHTSSEWTNYVTPIEAYFLNMKLSQDRTRQVLKFCLTQTSSEKLLNWGKNILVAAGMSSSRLIKVNDVEMPELSRRVEFRVYTNAAEKLSLILTKNPKVVQDTSVVDINR